jgi:hypothetical protein
MDHIVVGRGCGEEWLVGEIVLFVLSRHSMVRSTNYV